VSTNTPTTLILRFRDLVTVPGDTIANHNAISDRNGHVWWGWWNKSGEKVPDATFRELNKVAKSTNGLKILLLDSGRDAVLTATCYGIDWNKDQARIPSPERTLTPDYYSDQTYFAWFKLGPIASTDASELQNFTYVRVDDFFENSLSRYAPFYGKRVHDPDELRQQDRTIWFVRAFAASTDLVHQLLLLNGKQIAPCDYESEFAKSKSLNLLWVSDLHFSDGNNHAFPASSTSTRRDLGQAIEDAAKSSGIHDFAGVLVSGDLTWQGSTGEFELARMFLRRLATSPSRLDNYRFAIVPGNHDLKFSPEPANKAAAVNEALAPDEARAEFARFYRELFYLSPNRHLSSGRRFLLGGCIPVEIACLNSSVIEQKKGWYQGHGFVGDDQLGHVAQGMGWTQPTPATRPFRIAILHHHLMPVAYRETPFGGAAYSVVFDAEAIVQWLVTHRVDLVLHGHMHKSFTARVSRPIDESPDGPSAWHTFHVLGLGSSGVSKDHRSDANCFGVLQFNGKSLQVTIVSVDPAEPSKVLSRTQVDLDRFR
jgi:hypothetical protein